MSSRALIDQWHSDRWRPLSGRRFQFAPRRLRLDWSL